VVAGLCVAGALVVDRWHARKRVTEGCCVQRCTPGPMPERANLDTRLLGCADVAAFPAGASAFGCRQMAGNIWEWTASACYPCPGSLVDSPYREYAAPWFGSRHVLKGGAWATRARLAYNTYRNFFPPAVMSMPGFAPSRGRSRG
jgi:formylglycine-generating enzyme required for sulfatase activity